MKRKLAPALDSLCRSESLPSVGILAIGRQDLSNDGFRKSLAEFAASVGTTYSEDFLSRISYLRLDMADSEAYAPLRNYAAANPGAAFSFYLSVPPELFAPVTEGIGKAGLASDPSRIAFEKPFGSDLASASELNAAVTKTFAERQIYRIDHYVGKDAVQNVLAFRFANSIFEPVWNNRYVDHIQITAAESLGVEDRGGYYDRSGAIRDMVQNHLFQVLALTVMEPPHDLSGQSLHDEKVKVIRSLRLGKNLASHAVFGQYEGYLSEKGVAPDSRTETYAALRLEVHNWRFKGVPVYLRTGKALDAKTTRVVVAFKEIPSVLFNEGGSAVPNRIVFEVSPKEGIVVQFNVKGRSGKDSLRHVRSEFADSEPSQEAYGRILSDFLEGDHTLFTRWDMIEESWRLVDELVHCKTGCPILHPYAPGTSGPVAANALIESDGREWL